jgi:hypothetical protein
MTRTLVPTPLPVDYVTPSSADDAARLYGRGSELHIAMDRLENPRPMVCRECAVPVTPGRNYWCEACRTREKRFDRVRSAFMWLGEMVRLVEETARSFYEADFEPADDYRGMTDWRPLAFRALGTLSRRSPDLLPFQPSELVDDEPWSER